VEEQLRGERLREGSDDQVVDNVRQRRPRGNGRIHVGDDGCPRIAENAIRPDLRVDTPHDAVALFGEKKIHGVPVDGGVHFGEMPPAQLVGGRAEGYGVGGGLVAFAQRWTSCQSQAGLPPTVQRGGGPSGCRARQALRLNDADGRLLVGDGAQRGRCGRPDL
jgi:hypothetical protein